MKDILKVDVNGDWRQFLDGARPGCEMLGTVQLGKITGALGKTENEYLLIDGIACTVLDARRVKAQLGISNNAGAPEQMQSGRSVKVYLDADSIERAKILGNGNVSAGIRSALIAASNASQSNLSSITIILRQIMRIDD